MAVEVSGNHGYAACITTARASMNGFIIWQGLGGVYTAVSHLIGEMIKLTLHAVIEKLAILLTSERM